MSCWLQSSISSLQIETDQNESEIKSLEVAGKNKKLDKDKMIWSRRNTDSSQEPNFAENEYIYDKLSIISIDEVESGGESWVSLFSFDSLSESSSCMDFKIFCIFKVFSCDWKQYQKWHRWITYGFYSSHQFSCG